MIYIYIQDPLNETVHNRYAQNVGSVLISRKKQTLTLCRCFLFRGMYGQGGFYYKRMTKNNGLLLSWPRRGQQAALAAICLWLATWYVSAVGYATWDVFLIKFSAAKVWLRQSQAGRPILTTPPFKDSVFFCIFVFTQK